VAKHEEDFQSYLSIRASAPLSAHDFLALYKQVSTEHSQHSLCERESALLPLSLPSQVWLE
jgi:hypothetical protein